MHSLNMAMQREPWGFVPLQRERGLRQDLNLAEPRAAEPQHHVTPAVSSCTELVLGDLIADSFRNVLPAMARKSLDHVFDCQLPGVKVVGDSLALRCSLHKLLCAAVDLTDSGLVILDVQGRQVLDRLHVDVSIASAGVSASLRTIERVLARLGLSTETVDDNSRLLRAEGRCSQTGVSVEFAAVKGDSYLFKFAYVLRITEVDPSDGLVDARHARAWLIDGDNPTAHVTCPLPPYQSHGGSPG